MRVLFVLHYLSVGMAFGAAVRLIALVFTKSRCSHLGYTLISCKYYYVYLITYKIFLPNHLQRFHFYKTPEGIFTFFGIAIQDGGFQIQTYYPYLKGRQK